MKASEVLRKAKELIGTPERWTQGVSAKNADGWGVESTDSSAVCFCSQGAIRATNAPSRYAAYRMFRDANGLSGIVGFNDTEGRTHAEVMAAFDKAIAFAEKEEAGQ